MRKLLYKLLLWVVQEGQNQQEQLALNSPEEIDQSFRNMSNERIHTLEEKFSLLLNHLKISIEKPYGFQIREWEDGKNESIRNAIMQSASAKPSTTRGIGLKLK